MQHVLNARDNDKKLGEKENEKEGILHEIDDRQQGELKGESHSDVHRPEDRERRMKWKKENTYHSVPEYSSHLEKPEHSSHLEY